MIKRSLLSFAVFALQFFWVQIAGTTEIYGQPPTTRFSVTERRISALDSDQERLMRLALRLFEAVMNDPQFRQDLWALDRVEYNVPIKPSDRLKKYKLEPNDKNLKLTTHEIITNLLNGTEYFDPHGVDRRIIIDNEADIIWTIRKRENRRGVRGSTYNKPSGRNGTILDIDYPIWTNSWFIIEVVGGKQDIFNLVEHLSHEWTHKFGVVDTKRGKKANKDLFSYVFGRLVEATAKRLAVECVS